MNNDNSNARASRQGSGTAHSDADLLFAEDFTANALLQVRVYWVETARVHEKPFLILVSAAPQAPAGKDGGKTYLLERPYGITMKFGVDELAALGFALDRIASGTAERDGTDNTWVKWADPTKAKSGNGDGIGKKMLSVAPVPKNNDKAKRTVNLSFYCLLATGTEDSRGILKNCKRDGQGIKYGITVNLGAYQAMAVAMNLLSLADKLTVIDRQHRIKRFRAAHAQPRGKSDDTRNLDDSAGSVSGSCGRGNMRLHQHARPDERAESGSAEAAGAHGVSSAPNRAESQAVNQTRPQPSSSGQSALASGRDTGAGVTHAEPGSRKPSTYGSRESDFAPRPARRLAN